MVIKRQCSFCAGEVEPGTGTMFVKRDGSVFYFCSSSCRKQQLVLGRVGHRLKWTRAHTIKRAADQRVGAGKRGAAKAPTSPAAPARPKESPTPAPAPAAEPAAKASEVTSAPAAAKPAADAPAKKPRAKKPKAPDAGASA